MPSPRQRLTPPAHRRPNRFLPGVEALEDRLAPAAGLSDIVVGRTLSTYTTGGVQNHALTLTYTVYNQQADDIGGVLLATTLQPGIDVQSASAPPNRSGQELAWSLGTLPAFGRASVTLTVRLPDAVPLQLDGGAKAFGTLNAGIVSDTTPAATLTNRTIPADQLAATPDANTNDPFVQEQAAKLDYDPQAIFDYLNSDVGYESYVGSLRGARGTLWSSAGNSLDEASLGVALFRASGIPARYAHGTLSDSLSKQLILSMFPAGFQTVGYITPGTPVADPANDPQLLAETRDHYWLQVDTGAGFRDADTSGLPGGGFGTAFTAATGTFTEVADALRHKVRVTLDAETYNSALAAFGVGSPLGTTTVLDRTFNAVDLVGRPLTIGHFVNSSGVGGGPLAATTNTYSPYFLLGDTARPGTGDEIVTGTTYQEVLTNFPLAALALTGLTVKVRTERPGAPAEEYERVLLDRIGFAVRQNGGRPDAPPGSAPALGPTDVYTLRIDSATPPAGVFSAYATARAELARRREPLTARLAAVNPAAPQPADQALIQQATLLAQQVNVLYTNQVATAFTRAADRIGREYAETELVKAYFDAPRITIVSATVGLAADGSAARVPKIDLRSDRVRVVAFPGQATAVTRVFNAQRGLIESAAEQAVFSVLPPGPAGATGTGVPVGAPAVVLAAAAQGIPLVSLNASSLSVLDGLALSPEAKARITRAVSRGLDVIVPAASVVIGGRPQIAWYERDLTTGETVAVSEDGSHGGIVEFGLLLAAVGSGLVISRILSLPDTPPTLSNTSEAANEAALRSAAMNILRTLKLELVTVSGQVRRDFEAEKPKNDPPIGQFLFSADYPEDRPTRNASRDLAVTPAAAAGAVAGAPAVANVQAAGDLAATWFAAAESTFTARTFQSGAATVRTAAGALVGAGAVALSSVAGVPVVAAGNYAVDVRGRGTLSVYGAPGSGLAASGEWDGYTAAVTGTPTFTLTTDGLTLNGVPLPAGTYTVSAPAAALTGTGATASPNFVGSATVAVANGTVELGAGSGTLSVGGGTLSAATGTTLAGYTGTVTIAAGATPAAALSGTAGRVLRVTTPAAVVPADQNTPVTIPVTVVTNVTDTYTLTAEAPAGWGVTIDAAGRVTVTPAPGLQGGTYPVRTVARSTTSPDVVAQTTVTVSVAATAPGVTLAVTPDPVFTVPYNGALLFTSFRADFRNLGPAADTFALSSANVPAGFVLRDNGPTVTVPAGATGVVGLYLDPVAGTALPAPGTVLTFDVSVASTTNGAITRTVTVTFTMPEVHAVALAGTPVALSTTPGQSVGGTLTLTAAGNVPETATLTATPGPGLSVSGLPPTVTLAPGQTVNLPFALTPSAATPLGTALELTVAMTLGASAPDEADRTLLIPVRVVVPGADAIATASAAAGALGNSDLANRLSDLSTALTNLVQTPTNPVFKSQALANLASIRTLLLVDPILATFADPLAGAATVFNAAQTAPQVQAAVVALGNVLDDFAATIDALTHSRVEVLLTPNSVVAQPGVSQQFGVLLHNVGDRTTTYDLTLLDLPANVTGSFSQPSVTLAPGEYSVGLTATLTQTSGAELQAFAFRVRATAAGAPLVSATATGTLQTRKEVVSVVSVGLSPSFVSAGGQVAVSARVLNAVNRQQDAHAYFEVRDSLGAIVFISPQTDLTLSVVQSLTTVALGALDTTGYANGEYTVTAVVLDAGGALIPGAIQDARLFVGSPVATTSGTAPATLPPGTNTVTTTVTASRGAAAAGQFQLVGQLAISDNLTFADIARYTGTFNGTTYDLLYAGGENGLYVVNVSDPTNPVLVRRTGGRSNSVVLDGDRLITIDHGPSNLIPAFASGTLSVFSLTSGAIFPPTTPANPFGTGQLNFDYQFVGNPLVIGNVVYAAEQNLFFSGSDPYHTQGDLVAFDISNPQNPVLLDVLDNTFGTTRDAEGINSGGPNPFFGVVRANANTLFVPSTTYTIQNNVTTPGVGLIRVVDITNPSSMQQVGALTIPNTTFATAVTVAGNRAYVVGSEGGWLDPFVNGDAGPTGRLVVTTLDITDPRNPSVLGQTTLDRSARLAGRLVDLGNGRFALTSRGALTETSPGVFTDSPVLLLLDLSNPASAVVLSQYDLTDDPLSLSFDGGHLYLTDTAGVKVFALGAGGAIPAQVQVKVPNGTGVAVVPGSFSAAPSNVIPGTDFDTLVWDVVLDDANPSRTFTFQSTVTGLQPGESRDVTVGTSTNFDFGGTPGLVTLPATSVAAEQVLGITPAVQTVRPGERADYTVTVANPGAVAVTYDLSVTGVPQSWVTIPARVTVPAGGSVTVPIAVASEPFAPVLDYNFVVTASVGGTRGSVEGTLTLLGAPLLAPAQPQAHGVVVEVLPSAAVAGQGTSVEYRVRVTNTGSAAETFALTVTPDLPADVVAALASNSAVIAPGAGNYREFVVVLTPRAGAPAGATGFTAVATSATTTGSARGGLTVAANGVDVELDRATGAPGDTFRVTVTNTGSATDTFDLSAAGPGGLVAALGAPRVTLAPGASETVTLTTGAAPFAVQGSLGLMVAARSTANPAVVKAAGAQLRIAATTGLAADFTPGARVLPAPGQADFLLRIDNTGNTEGAYSVTLTGTTGPVGAWLVGPDGVPTQQIPTIRLPGLASGAVLVRAALSATGTGAVTVAVRSLDTPALVATSTATLGAAPVAPVPAEPPGPGTASVTHLFAVAAGPGDARTGSHVKAFDTAGALRHSFYAYGAEFYGGVTVATADLNGDGTDDIITGTASGADHVKVFDGRTGLELAGLLAFGGYRGGVTVAAAGNLVAVGAGPGSAPHVKLFRYEGGALREVASFLAFDAGFVGGVSVGLDGSTGRLVVGAGAGALPHVKVFDVNTLSLVGSYLAFAAGFVGGVSVTAHDGVIGVGAGSGGSGHVKTFDGKTLVERASFYATGGEQARVGGVAGAEPLLLIGSGPGTRPRVAVYSNSAPQLIFDAFEANFLGGIFVG